VLRLQTVDYDKRQLLINANRFDIGRHKLLRTPWFVYTLYDVSNSMPLRIPGTILSATVCGVWMRRRVTSAIQICLLLFVVLRTQSLAALTTSPTPTSDLPPSLMFSTVLTGDGVQDWVYIAAKRTMNYQQQWLSPAGSARANDDVNLIKINMLTIPPRLWLLLHLIAYYNDRENLNLVDIIKCPVY